MRWGIVNVRTKKNWQFFTLKACHFRKNQWLYEYIWNVVRLDEINFQASFDQKIGVKWWIFSEKALTPLLQKKLRFDRDHFFVDFILIAKNLEYLAFCLYSRSVWLSKHLEMKRTRGVTQTLFCILGSRNYVK